MDTRNFIIFSQPSTGSSLLATVFTLHPQVKMYFEYQNFRHWPGLAEYNNGQGKVFGNKFISWDLASKVKIKLFEAMMREQKFKIIHLNRQQEDILGSYERRATLKNKRLGMTNSYSSEERTAHIECWEEHEEWHDKLIELGCDVVRCDYQEFINNPIEIGGQLMAWLELDYDEQAILNAPKYNLNRAQRRDGYSN